MVKSKKQKKNSEAILKSKNSKKKIPQRKFISAFNSACKHSSDSFWIDRNNCCSTYIHNVQEYNCSQTNDSQALELVRTCLARRSWKSFLKSFGTYKFLSRRASTVHFPIFLRYAVMFLAYKDIELAGKCLEFMLSETDGSIQIKLFTSLQGHAET